MGKLVRRTGARPSRLCSGHGRVGRTLELPVQAIFANFLACSSNVICKSASADRNGTDSSRVAVPTFLRVVLLRFATRCLQMAL